MFNSNLQSIDKMIIALNCDVYLIMDILNQGKYLFSILHFVHSQELCNKVQMMQEEELI